MENEKTTYEKVTETELNRLVELHTKVATTKEVIAENAIIIDRCTNDKQRLMFDFNQSSSEYEALQKELHDKYGGNISVNLKTGDITYGGNS